MMPTRALQRWLATACGTARESDPAVPLRTFNDVLCNLRFPGLLGRKIRQCWRCPRLLRS